MKKIVLFLLTLLPTLVMADLQEDSKIMMRYNSLSISEVKEATADVKYEPATSNSMAFYKGSILVKAVVEGNTCTADESTLGTLFVSKNNKSYIELIVGTPDLKGDDIGCPQYSKPTEMTINLPVFQVVSAYSPTKTKPRSLGVVEYSNLLTGESGETEIQYAIEDGKFTVTLVKLK